VRFFMRSRAFLHFTGVPSLAPGVCGRPGRPEEAIFGVTDSNTVLLSRKQNSESNTVLLLRKQNRQASGSEGLDSKRIQSTALVVAVRASTPSE
jgi:hypothetical protein